MGVLSNIFKKKTKTDTSAKANQLLTLGSQISYLLGDSVDPYKNLRVRRDVNKIAESIAITPLKFERRNSEGRLEINDDNPIVQLINTRPNDYMSGYDLIKQWVIQYLLTNNGYLWLKRNSYYEVEEIIPVICNNARLLVPKEAPKNLFIEFTLQDGVQKIVSYENVLHIRKDFGAKDFFGDNPEPLKVIVDINNELWKNMVEYTNNASFSRGFLQTQSILNPKDIEEAQNELAKLFKNNNKGTFPVLDGKYDYKSINSQLPSLDSNIIKKDIDEIDSYFGINEEILQGKADEKILKAYHKLTLEPIFTAIEKEMNSKLLSSKQIIGWENKFKFVCNEFEHMTTSEKKEVFTLLTNIGAVTLNEIRQAFGYDRIEGQEGDALMYSKNFAEKGKTEETSNNSNSDNSKNKKKVEEEKKNQEEEEEK